ncbi:MAG: VWA domain-containing protein [Gemmatimonadetes bacterium]|nr:VWA domain-containing protein [Gemmatimonadota bacterium]
MNPGAGPRGQGRLAENIANFVRLLRDAGVTVGPGNLLTAIRAASSVDIAHREQFYWALHGTLISRPEDRAIFRAAFGYFWRDPYGVDAALAALLSRSTLPSTKKRPQAPARLGPSAAARAPRATPRTETVQTMDVRMVSSPREVLRAKDFDDMTPEEMRDAKDAIRRLSLRLPDLPTRRLRRSSVRHEVDLRRTLAGARRTGGDPIRIQWRAPVRRPPSIVILCDVSGSMETYVRILLHFFHALTNARDRVHTFVFGTRLSNITRLLRGKDVDRALNRVGSAVTDWYGGTRIGSALADFNRHWGRRVLGQGAIVLLVSDGLDREGGVGIEREAARLQRSCRRLVWLNPLLRYEAFEPKAAGIRSLLPHVDEHRKVHNLDSLRALAESLSGAPDARPFPTPGPRAVSARTGT